MQPHYIDDFDFIEEKEGKCCWAGCHANAEHPAPKSPNNLGDRYHFCLEHIRKYNKSWNFFKDMSDKQAQDYYLDSITGHRPTYKRAEDFKRYSAEDLREEVFREFRFGGYSENQNKQKEISPEDRKALKALGLNAPATMSEIKRKYKELAKRYHPDVNGGVESEKLKAINQAYSYLKNCKAYD